MRTRRVFKVKKKAFFLIFKGPSVAENGARCESAPLSEEKNFEIIWPVIGTVMNNLKLLGGGKSPIDFLENFIFFGTDCATTVKN